MSGGWVGGTNSCLGFLSDWVFGVSVATGVYCGDCLSFGVFVAWGTSPQGYRCFRF